MAKETTPEGRIRRWVTGVLSQARGDVAASTLAVMVNAGGTGTGRMRQYPASDVARDAARGAVDRAREHHPRARRGLRRRRRGRPAQRPALAAQAADPGRHGADRRAGTAGRRRAAGSCGPALTAAHRAAERGPLSTSPLRCGRVPRSPGRGPAARPSPNPGERGDDHDEQCTDGARRPLHDHLVGQPRRRVARDLPGVPRQGLPRGLRRVAEQVQEPVQGPGPRRRPAQAQLGRRDAQPPAGGRRRRRRGRVPEHGAAVLPELRALRAPAAARRLRAPPRRHPRPQPVARRTGATSSPSGAPASARSSSTTSTTRSPTSTGSRSTGCAAASCSPRSRPT